MCFLFQPGVCCSTVSCCSLHPQYCMSESIVSSEITWLKRIRLFSFKKQLTSLPPYHRKGFPLDMNHDETQMVYRKPHCDLISTEVKTLIKFPCRTYTNFYNKAWLMKLHNVTNVHNTFYPPPPPSPHSHSFQTCLTSTPTLHILYVSLIRHTWRDCKTWTGCVWQGRHEKCAGQGWL